MWKYGMNMEDVVEDARKDLHALQDGGVDGIIFSNEFSFPYQRNMDRNTVAAMAYVIGNLKSEIKVPFEEAYNLVVEGLAPLGEGYQNILRKGKADGWIDVCENEGKRSGAYSAGADVHPFVLLNYSGTLDSQFTLAHEMGHALHSYLSNKTQNPVDANYVIFVAEVASTCNEALLMEYLLNKTTDKKERAYLINHFLEQFKGTL